MCRGNRDRQIRPLALAGILACALSVLGCAAQVEESTVTKKAPPEVVAKLPEAKAESTAPAKPVPVGAPEFWQDIAELNEFHGYANGIRWRLGKQGIELEDATIEGHKVTPSVVQEVWANYGAIIEKWSVRYDVPVEVILTTICVESKGNPRAKGGKNIGLMQLLLPTARSVLKDPELTEQSLYDPNTNIQAGVAYIALQSGSTKFDPPKVAAAYNAGSLRSANNRWRMKQYGPHLDKTVVWFNEVLAFIASKKDPPRMSFASYFKEVP